MDELVERVYGIAPAVEDGALSRTSEYREIKDRQAALYRQLTAVLGDTYGQLLQGYNDALRAEQELSARHFFQEGFRAGQELTQYAT